MQDNFTAALAEVLKHEGGYVDHPRDPGGATNKGITIGTLRGWRGAPVTKTDVRNISDREVAAIYKANYWDRVKGDDLPSGLDYALFDFAVNSGPSRAVIFLQNIVGTADDGKMGPITLAAIEKHDASKLIVSLCGRRLDFLKRLSTWNTFGRGWSRRVAGVQSKALLMVNNRQPDDPGVEVTQPVDVSTKPNIFDLIAALVKAIALIFTRKAP